ncbi:hypothetical protein GCM10028895_55760 [Pontibacter rugosus]
MYNRIENLATSILKELNIDQAPIPIKEIARKKNIEIKPYDLGDGVSESYYLITVKVSLVTTRLNLL